VPNELSTLEIASHRGMYSAHFHSEIADLIDNLNVENPVVLADERVIACHENSLAPLLKKGALVKIRAVEANKSLEKMPDIMASLLDAGVRRGDVLVVIGGGIVQDIACFVASTLFRGLDWVFIPTTLLAQTDSCIGSKSSINMLGHKNIVGTFNPPNEVHVCKSFLSTLTDVEIKSGIGEMLKVHMVDQLSSLSQIVDNYDNLLAEPDVLMAFLYRSLEIKKRFIEIDEFDKDVRNLLNYGHSFGHAIEGATDFKVPHGIAVTMGMDIANYVSAELDIGTVTPFDISHSTFQKNYDGYESEPIPMAGFRASLEKDKKNIGNMLTLILPNKDDELEKVRVEKTDKFWSLCELFFTEVRIG